jgi:putative hemolysin
LRPPARAGTVLPDRRGVEQLGQLAGLITRRSQVQILPPLPLRDPPREPPGRVSPFRARAGAVPDRRRPPIHRTPPSPPARHATRSRAAALGLALVLAACGGGAGNEPPSEVPGGVGIANPASVHCLELGGTLEIVDGPDGQVGWCTLPDGRRVEEWELYRETHGG